MRRNRNRALCALLLCAFLLLSAPRAFAREPELASQAAILMDAETGQILYEKNAYEQMYPASITKILTGLLALESLDPSEVLIVSQQAVAQVPRTSSHIGLGLGEAITAEDALYAIALSSANDAAVVLAEAVSGSVEAFSERMNQEAKEIGAFNSNFVNPNGLPSQQHYTTAYDMALITQRALQQPDFLRYFGSGAYEMPATNLSAARSLVSKNQFIDGEQSCPGLLFSKTGWTSSAQGTLVTAAKRQGTTLIAVTLKSPLLTDKYFDTQKLFDYGFDSFYRVTVDDDFVLAQLREQGMGTNVELENFEPFSFLVSKDVPEEAVRLVVPGGFDPDSGVTTVPVSIVAQDDEGSFLLLKDMLLTLDITREEDVEPESLVPDVAAQPHNLGWIPLALMGGVVLLLLGKWGLDSRKAKSCGEAQQENAGSQ